MKFSFSYVKENPVMFGAIFIVFGLLFWVLISGKGGKSAGGEVVSYAQAPVDPAVVQAQTAVAIAGIQAQATTQQGQLQLAALQQQGATQIGLAQITTQADMAAIAVQERLGVLGTQASLEALEMQLSNELALSQSNADFQIGYAKVAYDAATDQARVNANLAMSLSAQQLDAYKTGAFLSVVPTLKAKDRDNVLIAYAGGQ